MYDTLAKIMPLLLASTLSPGILALSIILLSKKQYGVGQTFALFIGSLISSIIVIIIGLVLGQKIQDPTGTNMVDNIVDIVLAGIFLFFGIKSFLYKDDDSKEKKIGHEEKRNLWMWLGIGFAVSITNFDAVIFDITAAKEVGQSALSSMQKTILLVIESFFFNLPIILPLVLYLFMPRIARRILDPLNVFLTKYGRFIVGAIFLGFGIYLAYKGLKTI